MPQNFAVINETKLINANLEIYLDVKLKPIKVHNHCIASLQKITQNLII